MPRTDKSVAFLTGMIVAALYVILLVSFSRETYVTRGRDRTVASASAVACADLSKQICPLNGAICTVAATGAQEPTCVVSVRMLRQLVDQQLRLPALELEGAEAGSDSE